MNTSRREWMGRMCEWDPESRERPDMRRIDWTRRWWVGVVAQERWQAFLDRDRRWMHHWWGVGMLLVVSL